MAFLLDRMLLLPAAQRTVASLSVQACTVVAQRLKCHYYSTNSHAENGSRDVGVEFLPKPDEGIAVVSLSRPNARNAIGRRMLTQLTEAIHEIHHHEGLRAVILRSTVDKVFCAGADLKERLAMSEQETLAFVNRLRSTFSQVAELPMATIAAIEGHALGGGLELALACDLRVASKGARLGLPETSLAIIPGAGGTQRLPRLIGVSKAKEMIFTGAIVDGVGAASIGLVDDCVDDGKAYERALLLAQAILPRVQRII
eukprot:jgi/Mesvir1/13570/Mv02989-RA.1